MTANPTGETERPELILTREPEDNYRLISDLADISVAIREYPCISTTIHPWDGSPVDGLFPWQFQIIAFTSRRGVRGMAPAAEQIRNGSVRLAAVGTRTADAVREMFGRDPSFVPESQTGESLATLLVKRVADEHTSPVRVLHARGNKYNPVFRQILEGAGMEVSFVEVYATRIPDLKPLTLAQNAVILFASPSAVRGFFTVNSRDQARIKCIAIGPVTRDALLKAGVNQVVTTPSSRHEDVVQFIRKYLEQ